MHLHRHPPLSSVNAFLDDRLPKDGSGHVLIAMENHEETRHLSYLTARQKTFTAAHNIGLYGLEFPPYITVFLWAYKDGTLTRMLGSKHQAEQYLTDIFVAFSSGAYKANAEAVARLAIKNLDAGVKVVAGDMRVLMEDDWKDVAHTMRAYSHTLAEYANIHGLPVDAVTAHMRERAPLRDQLFARAAELTAASLSKKQLKKLAWSYEESVGTLTRDILPEETRTLWVLHEAESLMAAHPAYLKQLHHMEALIRIGRKKHVPIGADALTAVVMNACMTPGTNSIIIAGVAHADGQGLSDTPEQYVHGTLPEHLQAVDKKLRVHTAILAGPGFLETCRQDFQQHKGAEELAVRSRNPTIALLNIKQGSCSEVARPDRVSVRSKVKQGLPETLPKERRTPTLMAQRVNPLLVPEIARAAQLVQQDWNPGLKQEKSVTLRSFSELRPQLKGHSR